MIRASSRIAASVPRATILPHPRILPRGRPYSTPADGPSPIRSGLISLGLLATAAGLYYLDTISDKSTETSYDKTFNIRIRNKDHAFTRKTNGEIETILHEHEDGQVIGRKGNPVIKWDRNWVGSNEPCEDRSAVDILPRAEGDINMFSIMDGHAGDATSKLLAKALHPTIALALAGLKAEQATPSGWKAWILGWKAGRAWTAPNVSAVLQEAYVNLDDNICQTPVRLLSTLNTPADGSPPTPAQTFVALSGPAQAGACSISTVVDSENNDLYVALTGDCRAVAGWQDAEGRWRCDVLSEDQMGENPREIERMRAEHPANERETVIMRGRVQGGLQPTRAFGDAVYKWTRDQADRINQVFQAEGAGPRPQRPTHYTPPYVTARPVVTHRKLSQGGEQLKFVVMATDGLWDRITSEESTLLVASYLNHQRHGDVSKVDLAKQILLAPPPSDRLYPAEDLPGTGSRAEGGWVFEGDANAATHLIRNSLGGSDRKTRGELLSMSGPTTRWLRDDMTVTVVFFGDST